MAASGLSLAFKPSPQLLSPSASKFRFVHFTDIHIQPELDGNLGVKEAVKKIKAMKTRPDFILIGGDHVMDLLKVTKQRADMQFKLLADALKPLEMPVYSVVGNHDVFGWGDKDSDKNSAYYGKKMIQDLVLKGSLYRAFSFNGWRFYLLDTVQPDLVDGWRSEIDPAQMAWLKTDLAKYPTMPKTLVLHCPAISTIVQVSEGANKAADDSWLITNGKEIVDLSIQNNVKLVLQGHTHVVEDISYGGVRFITGGSVCGNWWRGPRLGLFPEGYMVFDVSGDTFTNYYETYGWVARK